MKIIAGLGNPGSKYERTYHNVGFMAVDALSRKLGVSFSLKSKMQAMVGEVNSGGEKVLLVKPQTFMNLSGESLRAITDFYKVELKDLLVIYDDLDIEVGSLRFRKSGSSGTHNGMRNIVKELQSQDFPRARIGTANDNKYIPTIDYVLSNIPNEKMDKINEVIDAVVSLCTDFIKGASFDELMCKYNGKKGR